MGLLSDSRIDQAIEQGDLSITPYDEAQLQPASYDVTLDREFRIPKTGISQIDLANVPADHTDLVRVDNDGLVIEPGEFVLGSTREIVRLGRTLAARVEGKSSLGRLGLTIHVTAGFIDPGFEGHITLEMFNAAPWEIVLYPGMRVAQLAMMQVAGHVAKPYGQAGNRYQGQRGPTESRYRYDPAPAMP